MISTASDDDAQAQVAERPRLSLGALLLWSPVAPIWIWLTLVLAQSPGIGRGGYIVVPAVLFGITVALHRLLARRPNSWAIAAIAAPMIAWFSLVVIASWRD